MKNKRITNNRLFLNIQKCTYIILPSLLYLLIRKILYEITTNYLGGEGWKNKVVTGILLLFIIFFCIKHGEYCITREKFIFTAFFSSIVWGVLLGIVVSTLSQMDRSTDDFLNLVLLCLFGPICEELIYRGMTYTRCVSTFGDKYAVFVCSLLFAVAHVSLIDMLIAFFIGLLLGNERRKLHSIVYPIISHITINTVIVLISHHV